MNEFFENYADLTALSLTWLIPLALTIYVKRAARKKIRAAATYFFVFGPSGILSFVFFHLLENTYRAIEKSINGSFEYNFHFYALILFGLVLAYAGVLLLEACLSKCLAHSTDHRFYFHSVLLILLITLPLIPITPVAFVPVICASVSVLAFPFVQRKLKFPANDDANRPSLIGAKF